MVAGGDANIAFAGVSLPSLACRAPAGACRTGLRGLTQNAGGRKPPAGPAARPKKTACRGQQRRGAGRLPSCGAPKTSAGGRERGALPLPSFTPPRDPKGSRGGCVFRANGGHSPRHQFRVQNTPAIPRAILWMVVRNVAPSPFAFQVMTDELHGIPHTNHSASIWRRHHSRCSFSKNCSPRAICCSIVWVSESFS